MELEDMKIKAKSAEEEVITLRLSLESKHTEIEWETNKQIAHQIELDSMWRSHESEIKKLKTKHDKKVEKLSYKFQAMLDSKME